MGPTGDRKNIRKWWFNVAGATIVVILSIYCIMVDDILGLGPIWYVVLVVNLGVLVVSILCLYACYRPGTALDGFKVRVDGAYARLKGLFERKADDGSYP
jgi:hypothetical protein